MQSDFLARCRQVLSLYFPNSSTATIVPLTATGGFSGALISRVEIDSRSFCLRLWPESEPDPVRIAGLHNLLEHISRQGVSQVAVPLKSRTGSTLAWQGTHWWQLEPWLPGQADYHRLPSRARLKAAMHGLARWHIAAEMFVPHAREQRWFASHRAAHSPGLHERSSSLNAEFLSVRNNVFRPRLSTFPDSDTRELLSAIWSLVKLQAPAVLIRMGPSLASQVPLQPCLRDIWHDHLLFTGDELTGLIDPNACRTENVATDLARLLGSLVEDDRADWEFALDCYQAVRPLSLDELKLLPAFDESGVVLSGMTWLDWILVERRQFGNAPQVIERLQTVLRRLKQLRLKTQA